MFPKVLPKMKKKKFFFFKFFFFGSLFPLETENGKKKKEMYFITHIDIFQSIVNISLSINKSPTRHTHS